MTILIIGGSLVNKGAEAMLWTSIRELTQRIPEARFYIGDGRVRQMDPGEVEEAGIPMLRPRTLSARGRATRLLQRVATSPGSARTALRQRGTEEYVEGLAGSIDAALDISGFLWADGRGASSFTSLLHLQSALYRQGKAYVFMPQTFGPFEKRELREGTRGGLLGAAAFFARDRQSREHLARLLGRDLEAIPLSPDIAFRFHTDADGPALLRGLGLDPERPTVALSPNLRVYERNEGLGSTNTYLAALAELGRHLVAQGRQVLVVPHDMRRHLTPTLDDRMLCDVVALAIGSPAARAVTALTTAQDLKAMIGACELTVGSRFHALVASLSQAVPVVAVGWAHKYPELLRDFGLERYVFDAKEVEPAALIAHVEEAWEERAANRAQIQARLPEVKRQVDAVFDTVASALRARSSR